MRKFWVLVPLMFLPVNAHALSYKILEATERPEMHSLEVRVQVTDDSDKAQTVSRRIPLSSLDTKDRLLDAVRDIAIEVNGQIAVKEKISEAKSAIVAEIGKTVEVK